MEGLLQRKQQHTNLSVLAVLENTCTMVQCLAERRCSFENLVEYRLDCRWSH